MFSLFMIGHHSIIDDSICTTMQMIVFTRNSKRIENKKGDEEMRLELDKFKASSFSHARNYVAQAAALRSRFIDLDYHSMAPQ